MGSRGARIRRPLKSPLEVKLRAGWGRRSGVAGWGLEGPALDWQPEGHLCSTHGMVGTARCHAPHHALHAALAVQARPALKAQPFTIWAKDRETGSFPPVLLYGPRSPHSQTT